MGAAAEGMKVAVVTIDPARRLADALGLEELGQRAAADRPRALRRPRHRAARRAVGADARRQAHVRRADRAARARRADARRGAVQPHLRPALQRRRRLAGVHGDRQALRPRRERPLRPARARHAAVAQRARLPRRARAPHRLLPGPRDQGLPPPRGLRRAADRARHGRRVRAAAARDRRRPARGPVGLLPRAQRHDRRVRGARRPRERAALRPGDDVPHRHLAAATTRSRRRSSSTASCATRRCRSAGSSSTGCTLPPAVDGELPEALAERLGDALAGRVARSARELAALAARDAANVEHLRSTLGDPPLVIVPERHDDVHDVEGLAYVRAHLWGADAP